MQQTLDSYPGIVPGGMEILIIGGGGDTGSRLAQHLTSADGKLAITSRQSADELATQFPAGTTLLSLDPVGDPAGFEAGLLKYLQRRRTEVGAPPRLLVYNLLGAWLRDAHRVIREGHRVVLETLLAAQPRSLRYVACSATTIYGNRPFEALTEDSAPAPDTVIGRLLVDTEADIAAARDRFHAQGIPMDTLVLRVPHVYGPGRERSFELMCRGEFFIAGDGMNPMQHLHVEDFVQALVLGADPGRVRHGVVNLVEDRAEPYRYYCDYITEVMGIARLPCYMLEEARDSGIASRLLGPHFDNPAILAEFYRYMSCQATIANHKMRGQLGVRLRYPNFRDGLAQMLGQIRQAA